MTNNNRLSNLLLEENPLIILPKLATLIGLNEAIVLQQIHYWLKKSTKIIKDIKWTYNTIKNWREQFPFYSESTIRRTLEKLKKEKLTLEGNFNSTTYNRTKWYSINYDELQKRQIHFVKMTTPFVQNEQMEDVNMSNSLTETSTETSTENNIGDKKSQSSTEKNLINIPYYHLKDKGLLPPTQTAIDKWWWSAVAEIKALLKTETPLQVAIAFMWAIRDDFWKTAFNHPRQYMKIKQQLKEKQKTEGYKLDILKNKWEIMNAK